MWSALKLPHSLQCRLRWCSQCAAASRPGLPGSLAPLPVKESRGGYKCTENCFVTYNSILVKKNHQHQLTSGFCLQWERVQSAFTAGDRGFNRGYLPAHAKHSHWLLQSCRNEWTHQASPALPTGYWAWRWTPAAPESSRSKPASSLVSPHWLSTSPSECRYPCSAKKKRKEEKERRGNHETHWPLWLIFDPVQQLLALLTSLVLLMETMKSKKGSSPARCPGEFSWTCKRSERQPELLLDVTPSISLISDMLCAYSPNRLNRQESTCCVCVVMCPQYKR